MGKAVEPPLRVREDGWVFEKFPSLMVKRDGVILEDLSAKKAAQGMKERRRVMSQQMEEKAGATPVRSSYSRAARKIIFVKMLCSPVFVALYLFFCVVLYRFCMLGNVKKRGSLLVVCAVIFLLFLTLVFVESFV